MPAALVRMVGKMPTGMMANIRMDSLGVARNNEGYVQSEAPGSACAIFVKATRGTEKKAGMDLVRQLYVPLPRFETR